MFKNIKRWWHVKRNSARVAGMAEIVSDLIKDDLIKDGRLECFDNRVKLVIGNNNGFGLFSLFNSHISFSVGSDYKKAYKLLLDTFEKKRDQKQSELNRLTTELLNKQRSKEDDKRSASSGRKRASTKRRSNTRGAGRTSKGG